MVVDSILRASDIREYKNCQKSKILIVFLLLCSRLMTWSLGTEIVQYLGAITVGKSLRNGLHSNAKFTIVYTALRHVTVRCRSSYFRSLLNAKTMRVESAGSIF